MVSINDAGIYCTFNFGEQFVALETFSANKLLHKTVSSLELYKEKLYFKLLFFY